MLCSLCYIQTISQLCMSVRIADNRNLISSTTPASLLLSRLPIHNILYHFRISFFTVNNVCKWGMFKLRILCNFLLQLAIFCFFWSDIYTFRFYVFSDNDCVLTIRNRRNIEIHAVYVENDEDLRRIREKLIFNIPCLFMFFFWEHFPRAVVEVILYVAVNRKYS